jgi:hypothetical protein
VTSTAKPSVAEVGEAPGAEEAKVVADGEDERWEKVSSGQAVRNAAIGVRLGKYRCLFFWRNHRERMKVERSRPVGLVTQGPGSAMSKRTDARTTSFPMSNMTKSNILANAALDLRCAILHKSLYTDL